jgi:hypothetical protein
MTGCYLTTLPRAFMRGIADFDPEWSSSYFLPRETVCPPPLLLRRVWPDLDHWLAAHLERSDATERVQRLTATAAESCCRRLPRTLKETPLCILTSKRYSPMFSRSFSLLMRLNCSLGLSALASRISQPPNLPRSPFFRLRNISDLSSKSVVLLL